MKILLSVIVGYAVFAAVQIMYFKYKEAKFQKGKLQKNYNDVSAKA
jgi:hypothetical protein